MGYIEVMGKFRNKYRIPSARAPFRDYSQEGLYYITICTFQRETIFGHIENHAMILSPEGNIVQEEWNKSFEIRKELFCDAFIIMPNHLHAILRIENINTVETHGRASQSDCTDINETHGRASLQMMKYGIAYRSPKSISSFVAGFKSSATKRINDTRRHRDARPCVSTVWQPRFHDHIIRDDEEYQKIRDYINNNPAKWENDEFNGC